MWSYDLWIFVFVEDLTREAELLVDMYIKRHFTKNLLCHCGSWLTKSEIHETWKGREGREMQTMKCHQEENFRSGTPWAGLKLLSTAGLSSLSASVLNPAFIYLLNKAHQIIQDNLPHSKSVREFDHICKNAFIAIARLAFKWITGDCYLTNWHNIRRK